MICFIHFKPQLVSSQNLDCLTVYIPCIYIYTYTVFTSARLVERQWKFLVIKLEQTHSIHHTHTHTHTCTLLYRNTQIYMHISTRSKQRSHNCLIAANANANECNQRTVNNELWNFAYYTKPYLTYMYIYSIIYTVMWFLVCDVYVV